ncbi:uncharacterized protein LOC132699795 [Cylas formicarius]|uniref:uncharacterized protein LOC132699795 n=1 Tax=Cylas formicarius TaxID=197179 RepID=UPI002958CE4A|nr:uncharacterized protein LOC132699795 [Cylas formicarius]XP_060522673.1 uncharacterized protein LOC132699795 [Cylas formicarius]
MHYNFLVLICLMWLLCHPCAANSSRHQGPAALVRGKKSIPDSAYKPDEVVNSPKGTDFIAEDGAAPYNFPGSRIDSWGIPNYPQNVPDRERWDLVASQAAKNPHSNGDLLYNDFNKRGRFGFFAMRGKKVADNPTFQDFKRTRMGFFATRGKKNIEDFTSNNDKRRPPMGFFAVRGKKVVLGKKYPYECYHDIGRSDNSYYDGTVDLNQLMTLLSGPNDIDDFGSQ